MLLAKKPEIDTGHWAYLQGKTAGKEGKKSERGWMAFGLSCAATPLDASNTRHWLAGFDAGELEGPDKPAPAEFWDYDRTTGRRMSGSCYTGD